LSTPLPPEPFIPTDSFKLARIQEKSATLSYRRLLIGTCDKITRLNLAALQSRQQSIVINVFKNKLSSSSTLDTVSLHVLNGCKGDFLTLMFLVTQNLLIIIADAQTMM
jgi:hypothetical protein